ncbi:MAG: chemotaxis protein CheB [Bacteroidota bacterium]
MSDLTKIIAIGGSAGSVVVLFEFLRLIPADFRPPILIVMHRLREKRSELCKLFQSQTKLTVIEPVNITPIKGGCIYLAPPGVHMIVENKHELNIDNSPLVQFAKPSIDVLFSSAAEVFRKSLMGILITGTNRDGAMGMKAINENGGITVVQDPINARHSRMPQSAIDATKIDYILSKEKIFDLIINYKLTEKKKL